MPQRKLIDLEQFQGIECIAVKRLICQWDKLGQLITFLSQPEWHLFNLHQGKVFDLVFYQVGKAEK